MRRHAATWFRLTGLGTVLAAMSLVGFLPAHSQPAPQDAPASQEKKYPELPEGPGKDTLVRVCSKCHSPDNVMANGQSREGWEDTISKMVRLGAAGTDDEFSDILDYLVKNYPAGSTGPVNVNKATATQLGTQLGMSASEAGAVVQYREKNGPFKSIDDLKKIPEIDAKNLEAKKGRLAF